MKILAVDPGEKKIGLAVSDEAGVAARALGVLPSRTLEQDCADILRIASEEKAGMILLGLAHEPGTPVSGGARSAHRLLAGLRASTRLPVRTADESFSTRTAQQVRLERGDPKKKRRAPDDSLAAAAFLQEYLDARNTQTE
jgi:putative holliday junction resolvase